MCIRDRFIKSLRLNVEKFSFAKNNGYYIANNPLRLGMNGYDIFGDIESVLNLLNPKDEISQQDFEDLRIKNCIPKVKKELKENILPLETNIWKYAISLNKGCYVGQEAIARVYYRGKPPRVMAKFLINKNIKEEDKIVFEGKNIGIITSITSDGKTGLGFILRVKAQEGKDYDGIILEKVCEELNV